MKQPNKTTRQVRKVPNPTGKGGFRDHPESCSNGHWKPENTLSYQYRRFMSMTIDQLQEWAKTPADQRTVAMDLAYNRVCEARHSLPDIKEITDRTEGKAPQFIGLGNSDQYGDKVGAVIDFETKPED